MLEKSEIDRFVADLAATCARHGVTVIGTIDGRATAVMRGQAIDLDTCGLDAAIVESLRDQDSAAGGATPGPFFA